MTTHKIEKIFKILSKQISNPKTELNYKNPYTFLISVVLSAQATDKSVNASTVELFKTIFMRDIKESEYGLALSEAVGHMNHLYEQGKIFRKLDNEGAYLWYKA